MAIFDSASKTTNNADGATIIAQCTNIKGEIDTTCSVHIDGGIEGDITSTNVVTIGKSGKANGQINASKLIVSGEFDGTADCESVEILPGGFIRGKIITGELIIEKQGFFEGESRKRGLNNNDKKTTTKLIKSKEESATT
jgi:cytoskeletal protein CcmA (bactofilin family)